MDQDIKSVTDILWVDVETTGLLEHSTDQILELSALITDKELEVLSVFPSYVVKADPRALENMNEWSQDNHTQTGLLKEVENSDNTLEDLDNAFMNFLESHGLYENIVIAGNSVSLDLKFIRHNLPKVSQMISHRIIDVSSFAEIIKRVSPNLYKHRPNKQSKHRATSDIRDSLEEMIYYQEIMFRSE